jgi:hypothetical protein
VRSLSYRRALSLTVLFVRVRALHVLGLLTLAGTSRSSAAQKTKVESQVLLTAEPGVQYAISPKGQHIAAVVLRGSRQVMVHDGADGPRFDEILRLKN